MNGSCLLPPNESLSTSVESMTSDSTLSLLQRYAFHSATSNNGAIVEIGAYRGASTIALAQGLKEAKASLTKVTSIDPHSPATGIYGGKFSHEDHKIYLHNLERFGVTHIVNHLCENSRSAIENWTSPVGLLWVDGDHSYEGVASDIELWTPFVSNGGTVIFDDVYVGSEVEAAIREHLPFSRFRLIEKTDQIAVFRKETHPRILYLCGGMQSSGSTLVSWCFLQRQDLDGIYDVDNAVIHQDFSCISTDSVWLKMTIGSFRLTELVSLYEAQGWVVRPLLVQRDLTSIYQSLREKSYGFDGATGDEPPIFTRIQRYLADLEIANTQGWPILKYEELIRDPVGELQRICTTLGLAWDEAMTTWPKSEAAIADMSNGNVAFRNTKQGSNGLLSTIKKYQIQAALAQRPKESGFLSSMAEALDLSPTASISLIKNTLSSLLTPVKFRGTQRYYVDQTKRELDQLKVKFNELGLEFDQLKQKHQRILNHLVFGRLLKLWQKLINKSFPVQ